MNLKIIYKEKFERDQKLRIAEEEDDYIDSEDEKREDLVRSSTLSGP